MLALVFAISLVASTASATVMKYADLEGLIEISDIIVEGSVAEQKVYFDEAQGRVVTDTTFKIERKFLGEVDSKVTIQQWQGTHKGITTQIPGDPNFDKGESVIVFLHRGPDGVVALSAMAQSKFSIFPTAQGKLVSRNFSDLSILLDDAALKKLVAPAKNEPSAGQIVKLPKETRSYESFVAELESLIAGIKGGTND
ncbi:hypothetical protein [Bradymonas sediminis]|uniref:Uncharacterized protein n=1 Tax=Bradymonas sediminis TaxID=1548548 RepID=A0A2Z4FP19_9DELT|nr:hypothetical protein [Bradymonas sediminis]AWV90485.1 hypothetical protein DN745_14565 [Bradymonas sediminis]